MVKTLTESWYCLIIHIVRTARLVRIVSLVKALACSYSVRKLASVAGPSVFIPNLNLSARLQGGGQNLIASFIPTLQNG